MKNITRLAIMGLLAVMFMGCYKQTRIEQMGTPVQFKVVSLDAPAPSRDEADVIITTHIKKASYLLKQRTADMPYTFTIFIDGQEFMEDVRGLEEIESDADTEYGKGVHYVLKKRFRLKPGLHEVAVKTEYGRSPKGRIELVGGKVYDLKFEPVYGPRKVGLKKTFHQGLVDYKIYLDGNEIK